MKLRINIELLVGLIAVALGLAAGAVLMLLTGNDPLEGYQFLFAGGLMNLERIGNTLAMATPLILTGLSVAFAFIPASSISARRGSCSLAVCWQPSSG